MNEAIYTEADIKEMSGRIKSLEAQDVGAIYAAMRDIGKTGQDKYMASGIIVTVTNLSGKELIAPTLVQDGFSSESIEALGADFHRTMMLRLSYINAELKEKNSENK